MMWLRCVSWHEVSEEDAWKPYMRIFFGQFQETHFGHLLFTQATYENNHVLLNHNCDASHYEIVSTLRLWSKITLDKWLRQKIIIVNIDCN